MDMAIMISLASVVVIVPRLEDPLLSASPSCWSWACPSRVEHKVTYQGQLESAVSPLILQYLDAVVATMVDPPVLLVEYVVVPVQMLEVRHDHVRELVSPPCRRHCQ